MIEIGPMPAGGRAAEPARRERLTERHVLALGLAASGAFVLAAIVTATVTVMQGGSSWAALHLALAGAATTAIGIFMPHFAVTLAGTRPEPASQRITGLVLISVGAAAAVLGMTVTVPSWAVIGAVAMIVGLGFTAWQTVAPTRSPLARRHPIVSVTYLAALAQLAAGVVLGGMVAAGLEPVVSAWATLRPTHAWLTLLGGVSLTIFGTLVYLAPTIVGARIRPSLALGAGAVGMIIGPPLAAIGFALDQRPAVIVGAAFTLIGAMGQAGYVADAVRRRGSFRSEHDWRRVAVWHLVAGTGWFALAIAVAFGELVTGRPVAGWSIGPLALPLVAGWMLQELVASWTYLAPSVTPGDPSRHAGQRTLLGAHSRLRPIAWNAGVAAAWAGLAFDLPVLAASGAIVVGAAAVGSVALLLRALTLRRYSRAAAGLI